MKTILICHHNAPLNRESLAHWLASFSDLVGIVLIREPRNKLFRRVKRELRRSGVIGFIDVLLFRLHYKLVWSRRDGRWMRQCMDSLSDRFKGELSHVPVLVTPSPNSRAVEQWIRDLAPDVMIARCKVILKERVFSIPTSGTYVFHPGICPEYRNAHGCFWALARGEFERVGMTLLRIDRGIDTGPVYGYYSYDFDGLNESHSVIQQRVVLENLDAIRDKLIEVHLGGAVAIDTSDRTSQVWGQPRLSAYYRWKRRMRQR